MYYYLNYVSGFKLAFYFDWQNSKKNYTQFSLLGAYIILQHQIVNKAYAKVYRHRVIFFQITLEPLLD